VRRPLIDVPAGDPSVALFTQGFMGLFGISGDDRYICPAPLYHAAPMQFTTSHTRIGATVVVLPRFDAELVLRVIQDQRVTSSQWVPTHFRRLLQLPEDVRKQYDMSSLRVAIHAAAPCPVPIKEAMIEWWGEAILEYYAGTEGGGTLIRSEEWLSHKGSVGRHWAGGKIWVLGEDGEEVSEPNQEGAIYFEAPATGRFSYYKDEEKTAKTYRGDLFTIGDIGYLDSEGYLFLTDRQSNMIISGGVNIYPQETEDHLIVHPKVDDVAVIGVPDEEMGEAVKAVVIPAQGVAPGEELARELIEHCREGIAHYKCPRTIDFVDELPRTETGKMAKRKLRDRYWAEHEGRI
jgi:long-chain acyl-CoA synthetase